MWRFRRWLVRLAAVVLSALVPVAVPAEPTGGPGETKIAPWLVNHLSEVGSDSFLVMFDSSASLRAALAAVDGQPPASSRVYDLLRARARELQRGTRRWLEASGIAFRPLYIVNALQVRGSLALTRAIAVRPEVVRIVGDPLVQGVESPVGLGPDGVCNLPYGISRIRADQVWRQDGAHGEGVVVASADTGVQWNHPALLGTYRGWDGRNTDHDYNWHDAIEDLAVPLDDYGHGTHTTGTMVGDDGAGNRIGVAPGARWIACRNMDHGFGRPSTYLECNQFFLAPYPHGGNPETDGDPSKAPDVTNNSWGCPPSEGCDPLVLEDSFAALSAAGILPVASAGNDGPRCSTVLDPPGIYGEAFVVGATDASDTLAEFSSRGPVTVDGSDRRRPDVAAPGVSVCSSYPTNRYAYSSGTSMASPHTAGAVALLWSARPQMKNLIRITSCAMTRSTGPATLTFPQVCGGTGPAARPNNMVGWGLLDAYAAVHLGPDRDADGVADACDCAPSNGGAHDTPHEAHGLAVGEGKSVLRWPSMSREAGPGTVWDVIRGELSRLRSDGSIEAAACLGNGLTDSVLSDPAVPANDDGYFYLVQGRNTCGNGGWGSSSSGAARTRPDCP